ncbi:HCP-like protein [Flagelloscypha sp. PMI_526]|nr:HCP-like protein [Flagelloscypha sp. PMI_526]
MAPHSPSTSSLHPPPTARSTSTTVSRSPSQVQIPRKPPSLRAASPVVEPYDRYSYYDLSSPTTDGEPTPPGSRDRLRSPSPLGSPSTQSFNSVPVRSENEPNLVNPTTAWDFLHLGINAHLASQPESLRQSAIYFEKSATIDGGCTLGMLMWGLALRHGWGVQKREKDAFTWLRKAAEGALESAGTGRSSENLNENELVVAIYEVGQCFFQGWGVPKDKTMAVSYYRTAARLGDADAQNDLAFCLANGKGCKKDRKEAAKWYRAAVKQGQSDVGLAWIYKEKFQD